MPASAFSYSIDQLRQIAADVLDHARSLGASAAETEVSEGFGQNVTVRRGEVETIEYNRDKGVGVTVYLGQQRGHASTSDFSPQAVRDTVRAAFSIAGFTAADDCAGLADPDLLARDLPDLDLYHPWDLPVEQAIERARACEAAALAVDPRITNSEGASVSTQQSHFIYANTLGFSGGYPSSRHSLTCSVIAGEGDEMQRDDWYTIARAAEDLEAVRRGGAPGGRALRAPAGGAQARDHGSPGAVRGARGVRAARSLRGCGQRRQPLPQGVVSARQPRPADLRAARADPRYPRRAPRPGQQPVRRRGRGHAFAAPIVRDGVLQGYFLGSYSARKLGMRSTGNAGGNHNLILDSTGEDFPALLRKMGRGLLVTELLGMGVNQVTGDYSRGAAGFWVENGELAFPVQEITIAGNLKDMFRGILAVGSDVIVRGSRQCGSILVDRMTLAGE